MKNSYEINKGTFIALEKKAIRTFGAFGRVLWLIFGVLWACAIVVFAKNVENPATEIALCSVIVAYCLYKVLLDAHARAYFRYFVLSKQNGKSSWTRTIAFEDDYIAFNDENIERTYKYTEIKEIAQNGSYIALVLYGKKIIWLKEDAFVDTTLAEVVAKITTKREYAQ